VTVTEPGALARGSAVANEVALAVLFTTALTLGAISWALIVPALGPGTALFAGPWAGIERGIAWTWPLLTLACGFTAAWSRRRLRRFVAMVASPRNVLPGLAVGLAATALVRVITSVGVLGVLEPAHVQFAPLPWLGFVAMTFAEVWLAGVVAASTLPSAAPRPRTLSLGWAVTWRTAGMLLPIAVAGLLSLTALTAVAALPGFALIAALERVPDLHFDGTLAARVYRPLSVGFVTLISLWVAIVVPLAAVLVPGHVFWRMVASVTGASAPEGEHLGHAEHAAPGLQELGGVELQHLEPERAGEPRSLGAPDGEEQVAAVRAAAVAREGTSL
jgi:hypothetical protein